VPWMNQNRNLRHSSAVAIRSSAVSDVIFIIAAAAFIAWGDHSGNTCPEVNAEHVWQPHHSLR
jgi:hypothetical protein